MTIFEYLEKNITHAYDVFEAEGYNLFWKLFPNGILDEVPFDFFRNPVRAYKTIHRNIKWMWQRIYRGWDDRAVWSVDYWLNDMMPNILKQLKETKNGVPVFDENMSLEEAEKKWNDILDEIISGFETSKEILEMKYKNMDEFKALEAKRIKGMSLFVEYYHALWD